MSAHIEGRLTLSPSEINACMLAETEPAMFPLFCIDVPGHRAGIWVWKSEANARRLVACWNACENVSTDWLESEKNIVLLGSPIADRFRDRERERDELIEALRNIRNGLHCGHAPTDMLAEIEDELVKHKAAA